MFIEGDDAAHFTGIGNSNIPYILKPGYYTFEKFDFDYDKKKLKLSVYLKDSVGTEFAVTAKIMISSHMRGMLVPFLKLSIENLI